MRKLGRITPQFTPRLRFADYLVAGAPPLPTKVNRSDQGAAWTKTMLANGPDPTVTDPTIRKFGVGNCVIARTLHLIQHMHYNAGTAVPQFTGDDALALYSDVTGYDPSKTDEHGNNPTDQGTDPNAMDTYWRTKGVPLPGGGRDYLLAYLAVSPSQSQEWERAIWEFDSVGVGLNLTKSAETTTTWAVIPNDPVIGGHEVLSSSYDLLSLDVETWGEVLTMTRGYLLKRCDQLTAYLSRDALNKSGVSETGLNYTAIAAAFPHLA